MKKRVEQRKIACLRGLDLAIEGGSAGVRRGVVSMILWIYRHCISPWKPHCCRFAPTCSRYAATAVIRFGLIKGGWLSLRRLTRCHPFYHGPLFDPVPSNEKQQPQYK